VERQSAEAECRYAQALSLGLHRRQYAACALRWAIQGPFASADAVSNVAWVPSTDTPDPSCKAVATTSKAHSPPLSGPAARAWQRALLTPDDPAIEGRFHVEHLVLRVFVAQADWGPGLPLLGVRIILAGHRLAPLRRRPRRELGADCGATCAAIVRLCVYGRGSELAL
jgi:hypothetical protein